MPTTTDLKQLVINTVESQEVYDYLKTNGLINEDEIYLVAGSIPTPDVSGQINTHNTDTSAHRGIRESITTHTGDTSIHVTAEEKAAWNAKVDESYVSSMIDAAIGNAIGGSY